MIIPLPTISACRISEKMAPVVEKLLSGITLGEGPHWDVAKQCLYFTDMTVSLINKYDPATKKHTKASVGTHNVSVIIPVKGQKNRFLLTLDQKVATASWDGENSEIADVEILYEVDKGTHHVFNDGKCDSSGRFWAGTMGAKATSVDAILDGQGTLYSFKNQDIQSHRGEIGIANGIAFNDNLKKMYYIDSYRGSVDQYDFDITTGTIENLTKIFTREKNDLDISSLFDGQTIDSEGNLWIAVFGAGKVIKIDPQKPETLLETIEFPNPCITSVAFGGPNLDELYVTSAKFTAFGSTDGNLFRVRGLNARGVPADEAVL